MWTTTDSFISSQNRPQSLSWGSQIAVKKCVKFLKKVHADPKCFSLFHVTYSNIRDE